MNRLAERIVLAVVSAVVIVILFKLGHQITPTRLLTLGAAGGVSLAAFIAAMQKENPKRELAVVMALLFTTLALTFAY
jgi:ABC-type Fe3+-siderophore transport system permease subunit